MGKLLRRLYIRAWLCFWFVLLGLWSVVNPRLGLKIVKSFTLAHKKAVDQKIDELHK